MFVCFGLFGVLCFITHLLIVDFTLAYEIYVGDYCRVNGSEYTVLFISARDETQKNKREASSENYTEVNDRTTTHNDGENDGALRRQDANATAAD